jgi:putative transcriptional regulator
MVKRRSDADKPEDKDPPPLTSGALDPTSVVESDFLEGRLLIAMPGIDDPRFDRAVLMVCVHDDGQAMAITLNRPLEGLTVKSLFGKLGIQTDGAPETPVLFGGPVETVRGYVLHTDDYSTSTSTLRVAPGVSLTDTREVLDALSDEDRRPRRFALALGYAGWGAGQLERELQDGVWLACEPDEELLFGDDYEGKWTRALAKIGVTPDRLSTQAGRA